MHISNDHYSLPSPSFRGSDEQLAQHPALVILVISNCVVQFMTYSNLQGEDKTLKNIHILFLVNYLISLRCRTILTVWFKRQ